MSLYKHVEIRWCVSMIEKGHLLISCGQLFAAVVMIV